MIFNSITDIKHDRSCKSLTGLTIDKFKILTGFFEQAVKEIKQKKIELGTLKSLPKGGKENHFKSAEQQLFFILYYKKNYPTFDVLGYLFGLSAGHAHDYVYEFLPYLQEALKKLEVLPERHFENADKFCDHIEDKEIIFDGMERPCNRPSNEEEQKLKYSGKKTAYGKKSGHYHSQ